MKPAYEIFILDGKTELPKEGTFYVIAREGIFLHKDTGLIKAVVKVNGISMLEEIETKAEILLPPLPPELAVRALLFFRRVYAHHHSEAGLLIHYHVQNGYLLTCPLQICSPASVSYEHVEHPEGYRLVGSIHSHGSMDAFHSGIDSKDEADFDGLHLTMGKIDHPYFSLAASAVVNGNRFKIDPERLVVGLKKVEYKPPILANPSWRRDGVPRENLSYLDSLLESSLQLDLTLAKLWKSEQVFYEVVLPNSEDYRNVGFPSHWLKALIQDKCWRNDDANQTDWRGRDRLPVTPDPAKIP